MRSGDDSDVPESADEAVFRRLFQSVGRRPRPTEEQLARWRRHFETEFALVRRRRFFGSVVAAAGLAAAAVLAVGVFWSGHPAGPAPARVAEVVSVMGGVVVRSPDQTVTSLVPGDAVASGQQVESGLRSSAAVIYRGADVRLDASTAVVVGETIRLLAGRVYVDTGAQPDPSGGKVSIETPGGVFSHAGTQFVVSVAPQEVMGAVREGSILLRDGDTEVRLSATPGNARMVMVSERDGIRQSDVPPRGSMWAWAEAASPGISLAGRRADDVLRWVARERGQRLHYQSEQAARAARSATLAGSGSPVPADAALRVLTAATGLRVVNAAGDRLAVALQSEGDEHAQ